MEIQNQAPWHEDMLARNADPGAIRPGLTLPVPLLLPVTVPAQVAA